MAGEELERFLHQRQLVGMIHRAGDIDQEDEVARRARFGGELAALQGDLDEGMGGGPGAGGGLDVDGEGIFALRRGVVIGEIVDQFLDADGVGGRELAGFQKAADVGIGRRVHVDGEGGERFIEDRPERVGRERGIGFGGFRRHLLIEGRGYGATVHHYPDGIFRSLGGAVSGIGIVPIGPGFIGGGGKPCRRGFGHDRLSNNQRGDG